RSDGGPGFAPVISPGTLAEDYATHADLLPVFPERRLFDGHVDLSARRRRGLVLSDGDEHLLWLADRARPGEPLVGAGAQPHSRRNRAALRLHPRQIGFEYQ